MSTHDFEALVELAWQVGHAAQRADCSLVCAESCTGGLIAQLLTERAGSSAWFERGFVTYSNQAKIDSLGVSAAVLSQHGAVSEPVAVAMAEGALRASGAQFSLAVTGIAGPGGGSPEKPVGTVCLAWSSAGSTKVQTVRFAGDRRAVRAQTAQFSLQQALAWLQALRPKSPG
jgi:nicotinamide-nucleotide amidase